MKYVRIKNKLNHIIQKDEKVQISYKPKDTKIWCTMKPRRNDYVHYLSEIRYYVKHDYNVKLFSENVKPIYIANID